MTNSILPIQPAESQPRIVSRELNFDFGQFFYPQEKRKIFEIRYFSSEITDSQGNKRTIKATVKPDATLGTLTTFDERVYYVLIEIWKEQGRSQKAFFSERELARRLRIKWGRYTAKAITDSLNRLRGVFIDWEGSFYDFKQARFIKIKNPFTVLNHLKVSSTKDEAFKAQIAEFSFDERVIENLNNNYCRPVRFDIILSFSSPLAQAVYTFLDRKLYGTKDYHRTTKGLLVDDLGLIGKTYQQKSNRIQYLSRIRGELLRKPTSTGEVIQRFELNTNRKDDALLLVERSGSSKRTKAESPQPTTTCQTNDSPNTPLKPPKNSKKPDPKQTPRAAPKKRVEGKYEAVEVLSYFDQIFFQKENKEFSQNAMLKASQLIKKYGLEKVKFLVDFAQREAPKTNYKPKTFQGILQYLDDANHEYEEEKRIAQVQKRQEEEQQKQRAENARIDHQKQYQQQYSEYINARVGELLNTSPEKLSQFQQWQEQQREEIAASQKRDALKELALRVFDSQGQFILRLQKFFQNDPDVHISDFWEWDKEKNPNFFR